MINTVLAANLKAVRNVAFYLKSTARIVELKLHGVTAPNSSLYHRRERSVAAAVNHIQRLHREAVSYGLFVDRMNIIAFAAVYKHCDTGILYRIVNSHLRLADNRPRFAVGIATCINRQLTDNERQLIVAPNLAPVSDKLS